MFYNTQNDPRWRDHTMAHPDDTLGKFGCLVTTLANILEITPEELNKILIEQNAYLGIHEEVKIEDRSKIIWEPFLEYFNLKRQLIVPGTLFGYDINPKTYFIGKYLINNTIPHFVNLTHIDGNLIQYFNVKTGNHETLERYRWVSFIKIFR